MEDMTDHERAIRLRRLWTFINELIDLCERRMEEDDLLPAHAIMALEMAKQTVTYDWFAYEPEGEE